jgi:hypothetical protein
MPAMRWLIGTVLVFLIGVIIYAASAMVSLDSLVQVVRNGDAAGVLQRTDAVRLRHSLVDQIVSAYLKQLGRDRQIKPLERLAVNTYGASIADAMIGKMLTEDNLTAILNKGVISMGGSAIATMASFSEIDTSKVLETLSRISLVKPVELFVRLGDNERAGGVSIHFEGSGWKLSGIQLPDEALQALARQLVNSRGR